MADDPPDTQNPPPGYQFTLRVITPDGKNVYSLMATDLAKVATLQSLQGGGNDGGQDARELVDLNAPISHKPYPPSHGTVDLFGTFIVNLSIYNPDRDE